MSVEYEGKGNSAYDAMISILDVNETVEELKTRNTGDGPDILLCKAVELLEDYRSALINVLENTDIKFWGTTYDNK